MPQNQSTRPVMSALLVAIVTSIMTLGVAHDEPVERSVRPASADARNASPDSSRRRRSSPAKVIAGEPFPVRGKLPEWAREHGRSKVWLQRHGRSGWRATKTNRATRSGSFEFRGVTVRPGTSRLRVAVSKKGRPVPATGTFRVRAVRQQVEVDVIPSLAQPGRVPAARPDGDLVTAQFTPPAVGLVATLERRTSSGWRKVKSERQDVTGQAVFEVDGRGPFRVVADPEGPGKVASDTVTVTSKPLLFADDFTGALDPAKWVHQERAKFAPASRSCAAPDPSATTSTGDTLRLGVRLDPALTDESCAYPGGTSPHLLNSQVATEGLFSFTYGYAAARMKVQKSRGMHSAFWMLPSGLESSRHDWFSHEASEVDVAEFFGAPAGKGPGLGIASFVHSADAEGNYIKVGDPVREGYNRITPHLKPEGHEWWDSYHVFSVEWTPTKLVFRIDGRIHHVETDLVPHASSYPVLSMLTADYELPQLAASSLNDYAEVDWVTVHGLG